MLEIKSQNYVLKSKVSEVLIEAERIAEKPKIMMEDHSKRDDENAEEKKEENGTVNAKPEAITTTSSSTTTTNNVILPDWYLTTECSVFSRDCIAQKLSQNTYSKYPFQVGKPFDHVYEWQTSLPNGWESNIEVDYPKDTSNHDPVIDDAARECARDIQQQSIDEQLDSLLDKLGRTLNMVSFAITDYFYSRDRFTMFMK